MNYKIHPGILVGVILLALVLYRGPDLFASIVGEPGSVEDLEHTAYTKTDCNTTWTVVRTNSDLDGLYTGHAIAVDVNGDGQLDRFTFSSKTCRASLDSYTTLPYQTPEGYDMQYNSPILYIYSTDTAGTGCMGLYARFNMVVGGDIPISDYPTEPYTANGQEVSIEGPNHPGTYVGCSQDSPSSPALVDCIDSSTVAVLDDGNRCDPDYVCADYGVDQVKCQSDCNPGDRACPAQNSATMFECVEMGSNVYVDSKTRNDYVCDYGPPNVQWKCGSTQKCEGLAPNSEVFSCSGLAGAEYYWFKDCPLGCDGNNCETCAQGDTKCIQNPTYGKWEELHCDSSPPSPNSAWELFSSYSPIKLCHGCNGDVCQLLGTGIPGDNYCDANFLYVLNNYGTDIVEGSGQACPLGCDNGATQCHLCDGSDSRHPFQMCDGTVGPINIYECDATNFYKSYDLSEIVDTCTNMCTPGQTPSQPAVCSNTCTDSLGNPVAGGGRFCSGDVLMECAGNQQSASPVEPNPCPLGCNEETDDCKKCNNEFPTYYCESSSEYWCDGTGYDYVEAGRYCPSGCTGSRCTQVKNSDNQPCSLNEWVCASTSAGSGFDARKQCIDPFGSGYPTTFSATADYDSCPLGCIVQSGNDQCVYCNAEPFACANAAGIAMDGDKYYVQCATSGPLAGKAWDVSTVQPCSSLLHATCDGGTGNNPAEVCTELFTDCQDYMGFCKPGGGGDLFRCIDRYTWSTTKKETCNPGLECIPDTSVPYQPGACQTCDPDSLNPYKCIGESIEGRCDESTQYSATTCAVVDGNPVPCDESTGRCTRNPNCGTWQNAITYFCVNGDTQGTCQANGQYYLETDCDNRGCNSATGQCNAVVECTTEGVWRCRDDDNPDDICTDTTCKEQQCTNGFWIDKQACGNLMCDDVDLRCKRCTADMEGCADRNGDGVNEVKSLCSSPQDIENNYLSLNDVACASPMTCIDDGTSVSCEGTCEEDDPQCVWTGGTPPAVKQVCSGGDYDWVEDCYIGCDGDNCDYCTGEPNVCVMHNNVLKVRQCRSDGKDWEYITCPEGKTCSGGECIAASTDCTYPSYRCEDPSPTYPSGRSQACIAEGYWGIFTVCTNFGCDSLGDHGLPGLCTPCESGDLQCDGNVLEGCYGSGITCLRACVTDASGAHCESYPGCEGGKAYVCEQDGTSWKSYACQNNGQTRAASGTTCGGNGCDSSTGLCRAECSQTIGDPLYLPALGKCVDDTLVEPQVTRKIKCNSYGIKEEIPPACALHECENVFDTSGNIISAHCISQCGEHAEGSYWCAHDSISNKDKTYTCSGGTPQALTTCDLGCAAEAPQSSNMCVQCLVSRSCDDVNNAILNTCNPPELTELIKVDCTSAAEPGTGHYCYENALGTDAWCGQCDLTECRDDLWLDECNNGIKVTRTCGQNFGCRTSGLVGVCNECGKDTTSCTGGVQTTCVNGVSSNPTSCNFGCRVTGTDAGKTCQSNPIIIIDKAPYVQDGKLKIKVQLLKEDQTVLKNAKFSGTLADSPQGGNPIPIQEVSANDLGVAELSVQMPDNPLSTYFIKVIATTYPKTVTIETPSFQELSILRGTTVRFVKKELIHYANQDLAIEYYFVNPSGIKLTDVTPMLSLSWKDAKMESGYVNELVSAGDYRLTVPKSLLMPRLNNNLYINISPLEPGNIVGGVVPSVILIGAPKIKIVPELPIDAEAKSTFDVIVRFYNPQNEIIDVDSVSATVDPGGLNLELMRVAEGQYSAGFRPAVDGTYTFTFVAAKEGFETTTVNEAMTIGDGASGTDECVYDSDCDESDYECINGLCRSKRGTSLVTYFIYSVLIFLIIYVGYKIYRREPILNFKRRTYKRSFMRSRRR